MSELIEKQKVLDALREIATEKFSLDDPYGVYINVLMDVEEKICRLPVVQPNGPDNLVKDSQGLAKDLVNDCISRKAAIDEVINLWADKPFGNPALVEIKDCIEKLPPAQPYTDEEIQKMQDIEQAQLDKAYEMGKADAMRWIPCSERLPEKNCRCLTTNTAWGAFEVDFNVWINGEWLYPNEKPIAWLPLPEPYRGRKQNG